MTLFSKLDQISIRASEARDILEIIESADCETVDEALNLIHEIYESHYSREIELESEIEKMTRK